MFQALTNMRVAETGKETRVPVLLSSVALSRGFAATNCWRDFWEGTDQMDLARDE